MTDDFGDASGAGIAHPVKITTAGRLLRKLAAGHAIAFELLAPRLEVPVRHLDECRAGMRTLDLEVQILLAGLATVLAPEHARLARQLHAQAQTALRLNTGANDVESHGSYDRIVWH